MDPTAAPELSDSAKFRIQILLKEYDTLRQEILGRINSRFTLIALGGALAVFLAKEQPNQWGLLLIAAWLLILFVVWWHTAVLLKDCARQVAEIENEVNVWAGAKLLSWESQVRGGWLRRVPRSYAFARGRGQTRPGSFDEGLGDK